jgi:hypothetical protein
MTSACMVRRDVYGNPTGLFSPDVWATIKPLPDAAAGPGGFENRTQATQPELLPAAGSGAKRRFNRYSATVYAAGHYAVEVATLVRGGLAATYYRPAPPSFSPPPEPPAPAAVSGAADTALGLPFKVRQDSSVDFSANASVGWGESSRLGVYVPGGFNVRWGGVMVSEPYPVGGEVAYNFSVKVAQSEQRVRLWVDNLLLIDQWTSLKALQVRGERNVTGESR